MNLANHSYRSLDFGSCRSACSGSTTLQLIPSSHAGNPEQVYAFWKEHIAIAAWFSPDQECVTSILLNRRYAVIGWNLDPEQVRDIVPGHEDNALALPLEGCGRPRRSSGGRQVGRIDEARYVWTWTLSRRRAWLDPWPAKRRPPVACRSPRD